MITQIAKELCTDKHCRARDELALELPNLQKLLTEAKHLQAETYKFYIKMVTDCTKVIEEYLVGKLFKPFSYNLFHVLFKPRVSWAFVLLREVVFKTKQSKTLRFVRSMRPFSFSCNSVIHQNVFSCAIAICYKCTLKQAD